MLKHRNISLPQNIWYMCMKHFSPHWLPEEGPHVEDEQEQQVGHDQPAEEAKALEM